ncbi:MAG: type II toxin-antitoxin system VapC family toxin [Pseudomonadota bacterium]|nr:type II toxin-antitoxin system VapC family toxin [Pseudomonadota bacterium]
MIIDTSAIIAIFLKEPGVDKLIEKLGQAERAGVGVPTLTETAIVLSARMGRDARAVLARFLQEGSITTVPFGDSHYGFATDAWLRFGKGRHPAGLNFGDCMSYATARLADEPLLCVGHDFAKTDLVLA